MLPLVAIVGRPNVGKSTLFNRLIGRKSALVADEPGLTRDRHYGQATWEDRSFLLIDTGGFETQASELRSDLPMEALVRAQTEMAIAEAELVVLLWDVRDGPTNDDGELVEMLRRTHKPIIYVANKVDGPKQDALVNAFYELGVDNVLGISAEHGLGVDDLIDAILAQLPPAPAKVDVEGGEGDGESAEEAAPLRLALVGRPNAGKSALLNRLVGAERSIVSEVPGTTRDPVDAEIVVNDQRYILVDTAGIRRKRRGGPVMEQISVLRALRAVAEADVACLLIDGTEEVSSQDAKIANMALEAGRGLLLVFTKSDLLGPKTPARQRVKQMLDDHLHFVDFAPHLLLSSKSGQGVDRLLPAVRRIHQEAARRIPTSELNRFLESLLDAHAPPAYRGRPVRLYYVTQATTRPPTFIISVSSVQGVVASYRRYISNRLREVYGFAGVPLRVFYRPHRAPKPGAKLKPAAREAKGHRLVAEGKKTRSGRRRRR